MPLSPNAPAPCHWFSSLAALLDIRSAPRRVRLFLGAVLAAGRRTVTGWLRAAGIPDEFRPAYTTAAAAGKRADLLAARLAHAALQPRLAAAQRLTFGIDDTPTQRYGPEVEGAGVRHHPTPGPAAARFVYGHVRGTLAWLARHPAWGAIALPLLARLYVRRKDLPRVPPDHRPAFRTKPELAVGLVRWAVTGPGFLGKAPWVVADGAYAQAAFLKPVRALGVTVVSRLRRDAALRCVPAPRRPGRRGRPRTDGERRIDPAKRAGQARGWRVGAFDLYGKRAAKAYKTFLATWRPAGGLVRVVLVREPRGWRAFFCTDPAAAVADVLGGVADRFGLETAFRDAKEVAGAGRRQVRFLWADVGAFHLCLWAYTLTEAWAWGRSADGLVDRSASPWDDPSRRPSHADKRRAWRRELMGPDIRAALRTATTDAEIEAAAERLIQWAA